MPGGGLRFVRASDKGEVEQAKRGEHDEHAEESAARVREDERRPQWNRQREVEGQSFAPLAEGREQQPQRRAQRHFGEVGEVVAIDELRVAVAVRGETRRDKAQRLGLRDLPRDAEECGADADADDGQDERAQPSWARRKA